MNLKQQVREAEMKLRLCESKAKSNDEKERCLRQYKIDVLKIKEEKDTNPMINDSDFFLVNRRGVDYKITAAKLKDYLNADPILPWEDHDGGIWHIKNATERIKLTRGPYVAYDIDGSNQRLIIKVEPGEELVFLTGTSAAELFYYNDGNWDFGDLTDTSNVTNMSMLFRSAQNFNSDISNLNTSNVTDMSHMFSDAQVFNQDISNWDVGNVTSMDGMFEYAEAFNQDISGWDTSSVMDKQMDWVFLYAQAFNQDLSKWCVSKIKTQPGNFKTNSGMPTDGSYDPKWGTCPRGEDNKP